MLQLPPLKHRCHHLLLSHRYLGVCFSKGVSKWLAQARAALPGWRCRRCSRGICLRPPAAPVPCAFCLSTTLRHPVRPLQITKARKRWYLGLYDKEEDAAAAYDQAALCAQVSTGGLPQAGCQCKRSYPRLSMHLLLCSL